MHTETDRKFYSEYLNIYAFAALGVVHPAGIEYCPIRMAAARAMAACDVKHERDPMPEARFLEALGRMFHTMSGGSAPETG